MKNLQIGDRVGYIHQKAEGRIVDILFSNATKKYLYSVKWDCIGMPTKSQHTEEELYLLEEKKYRCDVDIHGNVVVVVLYETVGDDDFEVARGHGHIIHEGVVGIAQAISYASKRILLEVNGGEIPSRGEEDVQV